MMSSVNAPTPRQWGQAVWTGKEFIVWGGVGTSLANSDGGRYDLATDTWIPFKTPNLYFTYDGAAFWNGSNARYICRYRWTNACCTYRNTAVTRVQVLRSSCIRTR
jgi:hypothetical protein